MDYKTIIIIVLSASLAAYFIPTPLEVQSHFKSGQDFYASKDYKRAIEQYDWIINAESSLLEADSVRVALVANDLEVAVRTAAYYQKGNALRNLGKKDESIENYRVVELRRDSPKLSALAQYQIYELYYADKEYQHTIEEIRTLIARHPLDERVPRGWYDMGWAFRELQMSDSSNIAFETLIREFPKSELNARARYELAQNYFDQGGWDKAITAFNDVIEKYRPETFASTDWESVELKAVRERRLFEAQAGRDVDASTLELVAKAQVKIGDAYRKKGEYDPAIQNYRKVISTFTLMPTLIEATFIKMAEYTTETKGFEEGIQIYKRAIDESFADKPLQAKLQYKIARTYQETKLYEQAGSEYLFYIQAFKPQADQIKFPTEQAYFLAVSNFYNARNYQKTLAYADTTLTAFPSTEFAPKLWMFKGLASLGIGRFDDARKHFESILQSSPGSNEAILARTQIGKSHFDERNYEKAAGIFEELLAGDQTKLDVSEVHYLLGLSYYGLSTHDKAIAHLASVEPTSSYYPFTFARVTRAYTAQQKYDEAAHYLERTFATAKRDTVDYRPFVRLARSELYTAQQKFDLAVTEFDSVVQYPSQTENTRVQAMYGRGLVYYEMGEFNEAAKDLQTCMNSAVFQQVFPALVSQAKERLAFSYVNLNKRKEGAQLLSELITSASTNIEKSRYLAALCEFHYRSGEYAKAIEVGNQILAMSERDEQSVVRAYVALSNSYGNLQQHDKAIAMLKEAGEKFPANSYIEEVFFQLAQIYYNAGDYKSGLEAFQSHIQRFPNSKFKEDASYYHAFSQYFLGQAEESIKSFRAFLKDYPNSKRAADVQLQIGEAYFNTSRFDEASKEYQALYKRFPQHELAAQAMFNEGWCYFQLKQNEKMLEVFRALIQKHPSTKFAADGQFTIGDYYYNEKAYDSALKAYQAFTTLFPNDSRVEEAKTLMKDLGQVEAYKEYEVAMAFFEAKNWSVAIEELTKVMDNYPETEIVYGCKTNVASAYEQLGERKKALAIFEDIIREWKSIEAARPAVFFAEMHKRWIEAGK